MDELVNFYLNIKARLNEKRTEKLSKERLQPIKHVSFAKFGESWLQKRQNRKAEKQRIKIEEGYYKGIGDAIKIIDKLFAEVEKNAGSN